MVVPKLAPFKGSSASATDKAVKHLIEYERVHRKALENQFED
jgi:hypothetical protein